MLETTSDVHNTPKCADLLLTYSTRHSFVGLQVTTHTSQSVQNETRIINTPVGRGLLSHLDTDVSCGYDESLTIAIDYSGLQTMANPK